MLGNMVRLARLWQGLLSCLASFLLVVLQIAPFLMPAAAEAQPVPINLDLSTTGRSPNGMSFAQGSTTIIDFATKPVWSIAGDLKNLGTVYAISTNPLVNMATISARNIFNGPGATITTVLPDGGLPGISGAIGNLSLTLAAVQNIVNQGAILSAADLISIAGGSFSNSTAAGHAAPVMQAVGDMSVLASRIVNQGTIASLNGNVNIANPTQYSSIVAQQFPGLLAANLSNVININNVTGSIRALNGVVNVGGAALGTKAILSMIGGDVSSRSLNLNGGSGTLRAFFNRVDGEMNVLARTADVGTSSGVLKLGTLKIDGDPTFFNDDGDIEITGPINVQQDLAILASGSITAGSGAPFTITARNGSGQGYGIYMVAGATLAVSGGTASGQLPPLTSPLPVNQTVSIVGASTGGGNISLEGTLLDTRSGGDNKNGGSVTLVAYEGTQTHANGGIEGVDIVSGGSGTGRNGSVTVIAGGGISGIAIDQVRVDANGGSSLQAAAVNFYAAQPTGKPIFNSFGLASVPFGFGALTSNNIQVNLPVVTDGGSIKMSTNGTITVNNGLNPNAPAVNSAGSLPGRDGGFVTLTGGNIVVQSPIVASGSDGADGADGLPGKPGGAGQAGGDGGTVRLNTTIGGITLSSDVITNGGRGGKGGKGGDGGITAQAGGTGGAGGMGGSGGTIALQTNNALVLQDSGKLLSAFGANPGDGGAGGSVTIASSTGADGGSGGSSALPGKGGTVSVRSGNGALTLNGSIDLHGGAGGAGGYGQDGLGGVSRGGNGGKTGFSSGGAKGGFLDVVTTNGNVTITEANLAGGAGGVTGDSGAGADGAVAGRGGLVNNSGNGGDGGMVSIISTNGTVTLVSDIHLNGGAGGDMRSVAGGGGTGTITGGIGGSILNAGNGGGGGMLTAITSGAITVSALIKANGGIGGDNHGTPGKGGTGNIGGRGGALGQSGDGGKGGSLSFTSKAGAISVSADLSASGNHAGEVNNTAGAGGQGLTGIGGSGGNVDIGGDGGKGGMITLAAKGGAAAVSADLFAKGGVGSNYAGVGGDGGEGSKTGNGGAGGLITDAGKGGDGGSVSIEATANIDVKTINVSAGSGGAQVGTGGKGATGKAGGAGGEVGDSGAGGLGGMVTLKTTQLIGPGTVTVDNGTILARGGDTGAYEATGGDGGEGLAGAGGSGGSLGSQGSAGNGGKVFITGLDLTLTPNGSIHADGGTSVGFELSSGSSGDGGYGTAGGGSGGGVGHSGNGGDGGLVQVDVKHAISIDNGGLFIFTDSIGARGGNVLDNRALSGNGGGADKGQGGAGGSIGLGGPNGSGGKGGTITILGDTGDVTGASTFGIISVAGGSLTGFYARTGNGGDVDTSGNGGAGGMVTGNGNGGKGGDIKITTSSGNIILTPLIATGGDIFGEWSPQTGHGGDSGTVLGNGGNGGDIGSNGTGGKGGTITLTTKSGAMGPPGNVTGPYLAFGGPIGFLGDSNPQTGGGGTAYSPSGNGGSSGKIGNNGKGGDGGSIFLTTDSGAIITPKGTMGVAGGDGGRFNATTGDGGDSTNANAGSSGLIGDNSGGGSGGMVNIISKTGDVTVNGSIIAVGGSAKGNLSSTGDGGNATTKGKGGSSGSIGQGGAGGKGGTVVISTGGAIVSSQEIVASGGNASSTLYRPTTGKGGDGTIRGGDSGGIASAGRAGKGGLISVESSAGSTDLDRLIVDGGMSGFLGLFDIPTRISMQARTGDGGKGAIGGDVGRIGDAAVGGDGGTIGVYADKEIHTSVQYRGNGGDGGGQESIGGKGGEGAAKGGAGGKVGSGGNGGAASQFISLTANEGPTLAIKVLTAHGGAGGKNFAVGGDGGDATESLGNGGGAGGSVGGSGSGGKGGKVTANVINLAQSIAANITATDDNIDANLTWDLSGGSGGVMSGTGGNGGNGMGGATGKKDSPGGAGGDAGLSGDGGGGGTLKLAVPYGKLTIFDVNLNGGSSGFQFGHGGTGGFGSGNKPGGDGGQVLKQGDGGAGGTFVFTGARALFEPKEHTPPNPNGVLFTLNGGAAGLYGAVGGDGGKGGGNGGNGGAVAAAGGGGKGGSFTVKTTDDIVFTRMVLEANGGDRTDMTATAGSGKDAGRSLLAGNGGKGGTIAGAGSAGGGGTISITSLESEFAGTGVIRANGGESLLVSMNGSSGGNAFLIGAGGAAGDVGPGPGAGGGGEIKISTEGKIDFEVFEAKGGSLAANSTYTSGNGGNGGSSFGDALSGGQILGTGNAGDGGRVELKTDSLTAVSGNIKVSVITVNGGSIPSFVAHSGNGGNGSLTKGANAKGGDGGAIKSNGIAGDGGAIEITTKGQVDAMVNPTDVWNASGGSVGDYKGESGNGGIGSPAPTQGGLPIGGGAGGGGGSLGNNGKAGSGGSISIEAKDLDVTVAGILRVDGGSVGLYKGKSGTGNTGGASGGDGGDLGNNGSAGSGGRIDLQADGGAIKTQLLSATAGTAGDHLGEGAMGGTADRTGGAGSSIDIGAAGGGGGTISVTNGGGNIEVQGNIDASAKDGGAQKGVAADGRDAVMKGGEGGSVGGSGAGGKGGFVQVKSDSGNIHVTGDVNVNSGNGGLQLGHAGKGGDATTTSTAKDTGVGGGGGKIGITGAGGAIGFFPARIDIEATSGAVTVDGSVLAQGGSGGSSSDATNHAVAGDGGTGTTKGGAGGHLLGTGAGSPGGAIALSAGTTLTVGGTITSTAGNGGAQTGATVGNGGNATGPAGVGGDGGNIIATGAGGRGGNITIDAPTQTIPTPTFAGGSGGAQKPLSERGKGGTGAGGNGHDGAVEPQGLPGGDGTYTNNLIPISFMETGSMFLAPTIDTVVHSKHGDFEIAAGSMVVMETSPVATTVLNLHDKKNGSVHYSDGLTHINVNLGHQLIVSKNERSLSEYHRTSTVPIRNTTTNVLQGGAAVELSEFSVVSALSNVQTLKALSASPIKSDRKHYEQIAKNACILDSLTLRKGPYRSQ